MSTERLFTFKNPWFGAAIGIAGAMVVLSLVAGFVILPYATTNAPFAGLWDAICSAAGVPRVTSDSPTPKPPAVTSNVVMNPQMFGPADTRSVGRGATLAMQCAICHGERLEGIAPSFPALLGVGSRLSNEKLLEVIRAGKGRIRASWGTTFERRRFSI